LKIAIFSDVHGNFEALEAVISAFSQDSPDLIVCLGDLVGYGPDPNACIEVVMDIADIVEIVGYIFHVIEPDECQFMFSDVTGDGLINIEDIVHIVGLIFGVI